MDNIQDSFVVYLRVDPSHAASLDEIEQPIAYCGTYAEALRVGRACLRNAQQSIIRFHGDVGAGALPPATWLTVGAASPRRPKAVRLNGARNPLACPPHFL